MTNTIAIVGGGFAGTLIAEALDPVAEVVLIDPRDAFVNVSASLRATTRPDWAPNAFFPYASLLTNGTHVRDFAASVDADGVLLTSGARVDADYIVLATGSTYAYPARPRKHDSGAAEALEDLQHTNEQLQAAGRVLILGAGPVGLELAGEIREVWPDKHITIVDPGHELLSGFLPEVRRELSQQLAALNIDVRLGTKLDGFPPTPEGEKGEFTVTTDSGQGISADIWFRSFGSRVNTSYLEDGHLITLDHGMVPVTDTLTVVGYDNIYAVGDITNLPDPKMATWAQTQAGVVVENLTAQLHGKPGDHTYTPVTADTRRIFLPLGSTGGVGQIPGPDGAPILAPVHVVIDRKGRDLFTSRFAQRFHQPSTT